RARRIKCDETPEKCRNCTSTGRDCDGYEIHRLPHLTKRSNYHLVTTAAIPWSTTSDERRCFAFVQAHTIPDALSYHDSPLWQQLILQMVNREPAVWHAMVALGAVHQEVEPSNLGIPTTLEWMAMAQSTRSFEILRRRNPQDPLMGDVTLLCCLLFIMKDLVRQDYDSSLQHLRAGLRIIREASARGSSPRETPPVYSFWATTFRHLDSQIGVEGRALWGDGGLEAGPPAANLWQSPQTVDTIQEVRHALEPDFNRFIKLGRRCWKMSRHEILSQSSELYLEQFELISQISCAMQFFETFRALRYDGPSTKDKRSADLLELWVSSVSLGTRTCTIHYDPTALQLFTPQYRALFRKVQRFIAELPERPTVTVDLGVIPLLFLVAEGCQDFQVRWQALQELRDWPHQEAPFNSETIASFLDERLRIE
ncbi:hypothetical protein BO70DRAFT_275984, partial [Aspergillus heteromorphus CBS 117.55]